MNIAIWIVIALVCFVIPATALTQGGNRNPQRGQLAKHAQHVGLPLPAAMVPRVVQRIKRRQRGMGIGGATGIVVATLIFIIFFDNDDGAAPALLIFFTAAGTALGGAWAIAAYRPGLETGRPTVARTRLVGLSDYLTKGERFGFWAVPVVLVLGAIGGIVLIQQLPEIPGINTVLIGSGIALVALLIWGVAFFAIRKVLDAPARSASELELAWDDAERADGLRQVSNLTVAVGWFSLVVWLICISEALIYEGFYRENEPLAWLIGGISLVFYGLLTAAMAGGPVTAWLSGRRKGYEQRQLWPTGVSA